MSHWYLKIFYMVLLRLAGMERVIVFGNLGYIGPVLVETLRDRNGVHITGYDSGLFERCYSTTSGNGRNVDVQYYGDVRALTNGLFEGVDAVIYLAAISNDPMGHAYAEPTHQINDIAAIDIAMSAKASGVGAFVFASSCSVYGAGGNRAKKETDLTDPLTDYATSKINAEDKLAQLAGPDFAVTCLRFATACGPSSRMRLDLVLNDFVATAITERRIVILSDGTPLRPLIDTRDMANALVWAAERPVETGGAFLLVNAGSDSWNYSILEIAERVSAHYGDIELDVNTEAAPDRRSYRVDFGLFRTLAPHVYPTRTLDDSVAAIDAALGASPLNLAGFREGPFIRLNLLRQLRESGVLDDRLRWT